MNFLSEYRHLHLKVCDPGGGQPARPMGKHVGDDQHGFVYNTRVVARNGFSEPHRYEWAGRLKRKLLTPHGSGVTRG